jgi:hypothetical protein
MKKLVLDLDAIEVTSFDTGAAPDARGTVRANAASRNSCEATCPDTIMANSCEISCDPSCISTCPVAPCITFDESCPCWLSPA